MDRDSQLTRVVLKLLEKDDAIRRIDLCDPVFVVGLGMLHRFLVYGMVFDKHFL